MSEEASPVTAVTVLKSKPEADDTLVIKLHCPYQFEGKEYKEIDLRGLNDLTCNDIINMSKDFNRITGGSDDMMAAIVPESSLEYVIFAASRATGLPIEFFQQLPAFESGKLRVAIIHFFHPSD